MARDFDHLEEWGKRCSSEYVQLEQAVYKYAARERLDRPFRVELRRHEELLQKVPTEFPGMVVGALIMRLVLGSEGALRRFLVKSSYSPHDEQAFASITARAWRFSFFQTEKRIAEGFFTIQELDGERDVILLSNSVEDRNRENSTFFLSGLFDNGECVQTFGPVLQMDAFSPADIESFARLAAPDLFATRGLGAVIEREALKFSLLFAFANSPVPVHDDEIIVYASSSIRIDDKFLSSLAAFPEREVLKGAWVAHLLKDWTPFSFLDLIVEEKRRKAVLFASTVERYMDAAANPPFDEFFAALPQYTARMSMVIAMESILGKQFPGTLEHLAPRNDKVAKADKSKREPINRAIAELTAASNENLGLDLEKLAAKHGVDREALDAVQAMLTKMDERFAIDLPYAIPGFVPPTPTHRRAFAEGFAGNSLFSFREGTELADWVASRANDCKLALPALMRGEMTLARLPALIERATIDLFKGASPTLLSYTAFLLRSAGSVPLDVRAYACEVLRIFWQVLIPYKDRTSINEFMDAYESWVLHVLQPFGLVELDGEPLLEMRKDSPIEIRRSSFFERWIDWR
ncbi:MAG TPA: hypothetical protein VMV90_10345 [Rectinemataceae bacterium]|nr:hypothetical protein [Rectinemataceae bacterium]